MNQDQPQPVRPHEQLFSEALNASPIGIAVEDLDGRPLFVNPALCAMLGFTEEEMRNKHCSEFSPQEDAEKDWALFEQLRAGLIDRYSLDKRFYRKDGSLIWGRLTISLFNHGSSPLVIGMVEDISEKRTAEAKLQESEANLKKLAGRLIEAQEEERRHLARELHDDISQDLALLSVRLQRLLKHPDSSVALHSQLEALLKQADEINDNVRALSRRFHTSRLETLGLVATMRSFCSEISQQRNVKVEFAHFGVPGELSEQVSLCLFRVLQEGLTNAVKHSGVKDFGVRLDRVSNELHLTIRDQGTGFDPGLVMYTTGLGLISMRERVGQVHGSLSIRSSPAGGTEIQVCVPVPPSTLN